MAIKGSLKEAGMADVCQLLAMGQKTGCLSVTDRSNFGQIYFDQGRITYARLVNRRDRIGDLLLRQGAITRDQLLEAVDVQAKEPDRRLGECMLELGIIDTETLTRAIEHQIQEAVYYLFTWQRGTFYFEVDKTPDGREILISANPENLLLEGARRVDEWSVIEGKVPSLDLIFEVDRDRLAGSSAELTTEQEALLPMLDGERSVRQLADRSGLGEFQTAKALFGLIQAGFAHRVGRRADAEPDDAVDIEEARNLGAAFYETAMYDDAEREFRRVLANAPHDGTARHSLALIALRQGRVDEAIRALSALLESVGPRVGALLNLAYALRLKRRWPSALAVLAEARAAAPADPRVPLAEGATHLFAGDVSAARHALAAHRELAGDTRSPAVYYYCAGLATAVDGQPEVAERFVAEGIDAYPGSAPLRLLAGTLAEGRADMDTAADAYRRAAGEDPTLAQPHRSLGDLAARRGADAEALEHYRRAAELDPDLGDELHTRMAELHYRRHERDAAIRAWRRALELNPANEEARSRLEVVARATG